MGERVMKRYYQITFDGTMTCIDEMEGECPATPEGWDQYNFITFTAAREAALAYLAEIKSDYTFAYQQMKKLRKQHCAVINIPDISGFLTDPVRTIEHSSPLPNNWPIVDTSAYLSLQRCPKTAVLTFKQKDTK